MRDQDMAQLVTLTAKDNVNSALQAVSRLMSVPGPTRDPAEPRHQAFVRIAQLQVNINLMLPSTTHSLSSMSHSKRMNMEEKINSTMLQTTAKKNTRRKKAITTNTSSDSLKSQQPPGHIEAMDALAVLEDAASEVEPPFVAEER